MQRDLQGWSGLNGPETVSTLHHRQHWVQHKPVLRRRPGQFLHSKELLGEGERPAVIGPRFQRLLPAGLARLSDSPTMLPPIPSAFRTLVEVVMRRRVTRSTCSSCATKPSWVTRTCTSTVSMLQVSHLLIQRVTLPPPSLVWCRPLHRLLLAGSTCELGMLRDAGMMGESLVTMNNTFVLADQK